MQLPASLAAVLTEPTPDALWRLRGDLLEVAMPADAAVWRVLDAFADYLLRLTTGATSRDYSNLASRLDISAISGVLIENLGEPGDAATMARRLLSSTISEGLMALATRQHVKAWEGELAAVHQEAAWRLYDELWRWSARQTPELSPAERRRLLDDLLAPVRAGQLAGAACATVLGRLFQVLLLGTLAEAARSRPKTTQGPDRE